VLPLTVLRIQSALPTHNPAKPAPNTTRAPQLQISARHPAAREQVPQERAEAFLEDQIRVQHGSEVLQVRAVLQHVSKPRELIRGHDDYDSGAAASIAASTTIDATGAVTMAQNRRQRGQRARGSAECGEVGAQVVCHRRTPPRAWSGEALGRRARRFARGHVAPLPSWRSVRLEPFYPEETALVRSAGTALGRRSWRTAGRRSGAGQWRSLRRRPPGTAGRCTGRVGRGGASAPSAADTRHPGISHASLSLWLPRPREHRAY